jgi:hypothetical protein
MTSSKIRTDDDLSKKDDLLKKLDDITLASIIKFIPLDKKSYITYAWDKKSLLWKPLESDQQVNPKIHEILQPILEQRKME